MFTKRAHHFSSSHSPNSFLVGGGDEQKRMGRRTQKQEEGEGVHARKCHIRRTHITGDTRFGTPRGYAGTKLPPVSSVSDRSSASLAPPPLRISVHGPSISLSSLLKSHQRNEEKKV
ncbi:hypothetical protein JTE90_014901 [Oedothorax gibbosus]|uniref:Uncharacterized protein n=1 Tax=Oedothorax gibbosus TaxID=931172 RepID=A0AAV6VKY2_9ARAC|nr:hypothetical protein JTE90_014901 [Oedothorax gibbosus]